MAIIDLPTCAGVPMYDDTPIPRNDPVMPKKLGSSDKAAIFLLALKIQKTGATQRKAWVFLNEMQKRRTFPVTSIHSKLLVKIAHKVAQDQS